MISFDLFLLFDTRPDPDGVAIEMSREDGEVARTTVTPTHNHSRLPVARVIVPSGQQPGWPVHMQMAVATRTLIQEHRENWISGTYGRFAQEWATVAEHLAEALRIGTAEQVNEALSLYDSTREVMSGVQEIPTGTDLG